MGTTRVEFVVGELRIVGGDYGQIHLEGLHPAARGLLDKIVASTRCGGDGPDLSLVVDYDDGATFKLEDRHAGLEGTYRGEREGTLRPLGQEGMVEGSTSPGEVEGGA